MQMKLPARFPHVLAEIRQAIENVEGWLKPCEVDFLALLAACPTAAGEILEIGCYHGKSTIALAKAAALSGCPRVVSVDPLQMQGAREALDRNLKAAGVDEFVELHQQTSIELSRSWSRPLRVLWIDGDHSLETKRLDLSQFAPHLTDGAVVAFHDVLSRFPGPLRVYMEDVLLSDNFACCGICGSIGWAQYRQNTAQAVDFRRRKLSVYRMLSRLVPSVAFGGWPKGMAKVEHEVFRSLIPRGSVTPARWLKQVA